MNCIHCKKKVWFRNTAKLWYDIDDSNSQYCWIDPAGGSQLHEPEFEAWLCLPSGHNVTFDELRADVDAALKKMGYNELSFTAITVQSLLERIEEQAALIELRKKTMVPK